MFIARVTGSVVATQKVDAMVGHKLMLIEPFRVNPDKRDELVTTNRSLVAIDTLGSGEGDFVLVTQGSSARMTPETREMPADAVIVGIIDQVNVEKDTIYRRQQTA